MPRENYLCPRCNYSTEKKSSMNNHLFKMKKQCPSSGSDLFLTEDIKMNILENRVYKIKDETKIMNQTINNYNTMNNFVSSMDTVDKITQLMAHRHLELTHFEETVEEHYGSVVELLEDCKVDHKLNKPDLMLIVDNLTRAIRGNQHSEFIKALNVIYDNKRKRIKIYSGQWEEHLVTNGLIYLVQCIVDYYLGAYEVYLIRKLNHPGITVQENSALLRCIEDYYQFIACFEIEPICKGKSDNQILMNISDDDMGEENEEDAYSISIRFTKIYERIDGSLTKAHQKAVRADMLDIIKANSQMNVIELDKNIIGLVNIDPDFKERLFCNKLQQ